MININNIHNRRTARTDLKHAESDTLYYNIRIINDTEERKVPAVFSENRVVPILEDPSEYELAVVRFKVPTKLIPIFLWNDALPFIITMSFDGTDVSETLQYIGDFTVEEDNALYGKAIWSYTTLTDIINVAFKDAYDALKILKPLAPPTSAPFISWDATTELFTIYTQQLYDTATNTIGIYFNYDLFNQVGGFQVSTQPAFIQPPLNVLKYARLNTKDNNINSLTYNAQPWFSYPQEYKTISSINSLSSISFNTDSIPVESEFLPTQNNTTRRILTDFEPLDQINNKESIFFYPQGPLRHYDLKSSFPLNRIDMRIYWIDNFGFEYPVYLARGEVLTLKLQFRKKSDLLLAQTLYREDDEF